MIKPRIILKIETEDDKIIGISIKDLVKKVGDSGYVALPRELINKYVQLTLEVLNWKKQKNKLKRIEKLNKIN